MFKPWKNARVHEGKIYFSIPEAARMLGTTTTKLSQIATAEKLEFTNLKVNGKLWVSEISLNAYQARQGKGPVAPKRVT